VHHPAHQALARRLLDRIGTGALPDVPVSEISSETYLSEERAARERALLGRFPGVVAAVGELAEPGAMLATDVGGVSVLVIRGSDGEVRGFRNACRHRATQLVAEGPPCRKKALVCPYHGWTYDLSGRLIHVPHEDSFEARCRDRDALVPVHVATRQGLIWASLDPFDSTFLAPIEGELDALGLSGWTLYRRVDREVQGNWKLVVDAFLDGYHIRHLHRDTVYRFFLDTQSETERAGPHIRSITARRTLLDHRAGGVEAIDDLRHVVTPSYLVFPNTTLILHPDYVSVVVALPITAGRCRFIHWMLLPEPPATPAAAEHWAKSFTLIDEGVFLREDLFAVEAMQRGLQTRADPTVLFGKHEHAAIWFHTAIEDALRASR
jgi:phenylpropionate dioxygenase-like ring-hydroxylating dioxygenase large terminal subunit